MGLSVCGPVCSCEQYVKGAIHSQLNWEILLCDVTPDGKTEYTAQFWQAIAQASELSPPVVFHTENCAVLSGNPTVSSVYMPTPRWHHLKTLNLPQWIKERRPLCSLKHTDRYLNAQEGTQNWPPPTPPHKKKRTTLMGNLCCAREHSVQFFMQSFYTVKLHSLTQCMGPLIRRMMRTAVKICSVAARNIPAISFDPFVLCDPSTVWEIRISAEQERKWLISWYVISYTSVFTSTSIFCYFFMRGSLFQFVW